MRQICRSFKHLPSKQLSFERYALFQTEGAFLMQTLSGRSVKLIWSISEMQTGLCYLQSILEILWILKYLSQVVFHLKQNSLAVAIKVLLLSKPFILIGGTSFMTWWHMTVLKSICYFGLSAWNPFSTPNAHTWLKPVIKPNLFLADCIRLETLWIWRTLQLFILYRKSSISGSHFAQEVQTSQQSVVDSVVSNQ